MGVLGGGGEYGGATIVIPSRLQVFLSRETFGWPLYGIILAFAQVCLSRALCVMVTTDHLTDAECDQVHRFAYNPGISLDVLLTMNVESIPRAHFDASIYSNILRCCVDVGMGKIVITCFS